MKEYLEKLNFTPKEAVIYLALLEVGKQSAANLAPKVKIPKSTTLFILENLTKRGVLQKSKRGKTHWFFADPEDLKRATKDQHQTEQHALEKVLPLLKEFRSPFSAPPKIAFFEGVKNCRQAYYKSLETQSEILEIGLNQDFAQRFGGEEFIENFIEKRLKKNISVRAISQTTVRKMSISKNDKSQQRSQHFLPKTTEIFSLITLWDDKILLLNLRGDAFGILIENEEMSFSFKAIFEVLYQLLPGDKS